MAAPSVKAFSRHHARRVFSRVLFAAVCFGLPSPVQAGPVPSDVAADLRRIHAAHGSPLLLASHDPDILNDLGRWLLRAEEPHIARRIPEVGTQSYERQIALERARLRCGVMVGKTWRLETFGTCSEWLDGPQTVSSAVPKRQPQTPRGRDFERSATIAVGPIMGTGTVVDISVEARVSRKGSAAFTYTAVHVRDWGSPALMAAQARRYFLGDVDRGLYGLAQFGLLSTDLGMVRSPGVAGGIGIKYTTRPGLVADGYLGAGPGYPVRLHPAVGGRLGWAF